MNMTAISRKNIHILIIDDDEEDFLIIKQLIGRIKGTTDFTLSWCSDYQEGVDTLCRGEHHLCFVDFRLGPRTGLELIDEVTLKKCEQPIVLLTGAGNHDIDLQAMQAGAADYLIKSELTTEKLGRCIRYALSRYEILHALKENEQKYRGIFEKTKDFIFIADEKLYFREINKIGTSLLGYSQIEFDAMPLFDLFVYESDIVAVKQALQQTGEIDDMEVELRAKNYRSINCTLSLTREKISGESFYFQGIIHDITTLKNAEQANLQTTKLQATERLVRTLAHEVRNPLNNIILAVEQLEIMPPDNEKVFLDIVTRNSNRINSLITELLYSSRPAVIELEEISLTTVLEKSIAASMDRITLKKIQLEQHFLTGSSTVLADPEKLSTAFLNIIINGIEASPEDQGRMTIHTHEERGNYIVSITDNGHGIEEANLGKLFEPYFTSKSAGMGLGLASALSIFESHKALVKVKSAIGKGTTFSIIFKKA